MEKSKLPKSEKISWEMNQNQCFQSNLQLAKYLHNDIVDLLARDVMAMGVVTAGIFLACGELLEVEM